MVDAAVACSMWWATRRAHAVVAHLFGLVPFRREAVGVVRVEGDPVLVALAEVPASEQAPAAPKSRVHTRTERVAVISERVAVISEKSARRRHIQKFEHIWSTCRAERVPAPPMKSAGVSCAIESARRVRWEKQCMK